MRFNHLSDDMPTRPPHSATHTIVIAEPELPTRLGLHAILTGQPGLHLPRPVSTATELLTAVSQYRPDAVLMGMWFSDGDGIDLCRTLLGRYPNMHVLFVANTANAQLLVHAVRAGALGFILKTIPLAQVPGIVAQALAGEPAFDQDLMSTALKWIGRQAESPQGLGPHLSPRHQQILPLLSDGLTNKEIGTQLSLSEKTVKNYLADLFDRLHMTRRSQVAAWFIGQTIQQMPPLNTSMMAEKIWKRTRPRSLSQEEPLHAHHSAY